MNETCDCCGRELGVLNFAFRDGKACEECFKKVCSLDRNTTGANFRMHTGAEIKAILTGGSGIAPQPGNTAQQASFPQAESNALAEEANNVDSKKISAEVSKGLFWGVIKGVLKLALLALIVLFVFNIGGFRDGFLSGFQEATASVDYVGMVKTAKPFDLTTYEEAFETTFDKNEWSTDTSDGKQYVQIQSQYNDLDDEMVTRILVTPLGDDQYSVQLSEIYLNGSKLLSTARDLVFAAVFKGDFASVLLDAMLHNAIFG